MTALPSFVELMASLGLDQTTKTRDQSPQSSQSSPSTSPHLPSAVVPLHTRSSTQSLRESSRPRVARYSPYSPVIPTSRRGSLSSISSSEYDGSPLSSSPRPSSSPRLARRSMNKLSVNVYGSATDLAANTPISSYVRRKTPGGSPTSPTFSSESRNSPPVSPMPVTVPTLPTLWPNSANSDSFPVTPNDTEPLASLNDYSFGDAYKMRRPRRNVGIRISTPPRSADFNAQYPRHSSLAHIV